MKKVLLALLILALAIGLVGCITIAPKEDTAPPEDEGVISTQAPETNDKGIEPIEIVKSGFSTDEDYVNYGFIVKNPNTDVAILFPSVKVTVRDEADNVISTSEAIIGRLLPGETTAFGGSADSKGVKVGKVEFTPVTPNEYNIKKADQLTDKEKAVLKVATLNEVSDEWSRSFTGDVENTSSASVEYASVAIVLYDADGNILAVETGYVNDIPANSKAPFEVYSYTKMDYKTAEAYALPN
jgi:hypothetical protein